MMIQKQTGHFPRARAAFTLIELLCVLVILAVLAAVVVPKFTSRTEQAKSTAAKTDISVLEGAIDAFQVDTGRFPTNEESLTVLVDMPQNVKNWQGPYIKKGVPSDPWGNAYVYRYPGAHHANGYDLFSMGPDGREGGDDVDNWSK
jgi:general secretion pathway protein G